MSYTGGGVILCTSTEWGLRNSLAEKASSVLVDKLNMVQQYALTKKANRSKELNPPVCSAWRDPYGMLETVLGFPVQVGHRLSGASLVKSY